MHAHPMVRKEDVADINSRYAPWRIEKAPRYRQTPLTVTVPAKVIGFDTQARNTETGAIIYRCEGWTQASRGQALNAILEKRQTQEETKMSDCIWKGTWQEKNCSAPACPKHGDPNWKKAQTETFIVERAHSRTEDGFLWYVVQKEGGALIPESGGWLHKEDAEKECEYLNWFWLLPEVERKAVETMQEDCGHNPYAYGVAVISKDGKGVEQYLFVYDMKEGTATPEEVWETALGDYRGTGNVVIDVNGNRAIA
jgi:hypothetical protein